MTITARYPGTCTQCGGPINPGESIEWDKGTRRSRHTACPARTEQPILNGPPPPVGSGPDVAAPIAIHAVSEIKPRAGETFRDRTHGLVTVVRVASRWLSADDAEDFDEFAIADRGGYQLTLYCRAATEEESAPVLADEAEARQQREARERAAAEARARQQSEADAFGAVLDSFEADRLVRAGYNWDRSAIRMRPYSEPEDVVAVMTRGFGGDSERIVAGQSDVTGNRCYVYYFGNAAVLIADRATVEAAWERSWQEMIERAGSLADAAWSVVTWLDRYGGENGPVAGHEVYEWVLATHGDELRAALVGHIVYVLAGTSDWNRKDQERQQSVAARYEVKAVLINHIRGLSYDAKQHVGRAAGLSMPAGKPAMAVQDLYRTETGDVIAQGYDGSWHQVPEDAARDLPQ